MQASGFALATYVRLVNALSFLFVPRNDIQRLSDRMFNQLRLMNVNAKISYAAKTSRGNCKNEYSLITWTHKFTFGYNDGRLSVRRPHSGAHTHTHTDLITILYYRIASPIAKHNDKLQSQSVFDYQVKVQFA